MTTTFTSGTNGPSYPLWIVCLTQDNLHLTQRAVHSFTRQTVPTAIFTVDNGSRDNTRQWLRSQGHDWILTFQRDHSVAASWNRALEFLWRSGVERALVCNNDVELEPHTAELLDEVSARLNREAIVTGVGVRSMEEVRHRWPADLLDSARPHPDFSCFLITRKVWDRVGPFDEKFHRAFGEDNDYHVRCRQAGVEAISVDVPFLHYGSATLKNMDWHDQMVVRIQADANREYFRKKYGFGIGTAEYEEFFKGYSR
jgi:O-antigen biosynthesis protein